MKRKKSRKRQLGRDLLFCVACLVASAALLWGGWQDVQNMLEIRQSIEDNEEKAAQLEQRQDDLETTRENLELKNRSSFKLGSNTTTSTPFAFSRFITP